MKKRLMKIMSFVLAFNMLWLIAMPAFAEIDAADDETIAIEDYAITEEQENYEITQEQEDILETQDFTLNQMTSINPIEYAPYNYKMSFEDSTDIVKHTSYKANPDPYKYKLVNDVKVYVDKDGKDLPPDAPDSEKVPSGSETAASNPSYSIGEGKYGNALITRFYNRYIVESDHKTRWGAVMELTLPTSKLLMKDAIGNEPAVYQNFGDATYGFQTVGFWVKTKQVSKEDRTKDSNGNPVTLSSTLSFDISFNGYRATARIDNNEEWQYVTIDAKNFLKSGRSILTNPQALYGNVTMIIAVGHSSIYGTDPKKTPEGQEPKDWVQDLYIDEMVFDRSTELLRTTTRPSVGEEAYYRNSNLSSILVDGYKVYDHTVSKGEEIIIPVPADININDPVGQIRFTAIPECVDIKGSKTQQIQSGAVAKINFSSELGQKGTIVVTAGSGETTTYDVTFEKGTSLVLADIKGLPQSLTAGRKNVSFFVKNYDTVPRNALVVAVLQNKEDGSLYQVLSASVKNISPGATSDRLTVILNVPTNASDYIAHYYFYDDFTHMNQVINPITLQSN